MMYAKAMGEVARDILWFGPSLGKSKYHAPIDG
jgi:hypothetical protein